MEEVKVPVFKYN